MSALALRYARKPIELADDLESFVYVLVFMLLRFHPHNFSNVLLDERDLPEAQVFERNCHNRLLVENILYPVFFQNYDLEDGLIGGGDAKLEQIKQGAPRFRLTVETPLQTLVDDLYKILHEHYEALDGDKLQTFFVRRLHQASEPAVVDTNSNPFELCLNLRWNSDLDTLFDNVRQSSSSPSLTKSVCSTSSVQAKPPSMRVLDSHSAMLVAFKKAFDSEWGQRAKTKTVDQFRGLPRLKAVASKKPSIGTSGSDLRVPSSF
jgi:hypothetical protein